MSFSDKPILPSQEKLQFTLGFNQLTVRKGMAYVREGRVVSVTHNPAGTTYMGRVQGTEVYDVTLSRDPKTGRWSGSCSCPVGVYCKHIYAVFHEIFFTDSSLAVADLQLNLPLAAPADPRLTLRQKLSEKLGRPLNDLENIQVSRAERCFLRLGSVLKPQDLADLGMAGQTTGWTVERLWPVTPATDHDLWMAVSAEAVNRKLPIPKVLEPVTDLAESARIMAEMRSKLETGRWLDLFQRTLSPEMEAQTIGLIDLRVRLRADHYDLEMASAQSPVFAPIKNATFRSWFNGNLSIADLTPDALVVWNLFRGCVSYPDRAGATYVTHGSLRLLNSLLRSEDLRSRVIGLDGEPARFEPEPLRWHLTRVAGSSYTLRLGRLDGSPAPRVAAVIGGRRCLYLTDGGVFLGEGASAPHLDPNKDNLIPVAAVETGTGADFLRRIGVPLPETLAARLRTVTLRPTLRGKLEPNRWGDGEIITLMAEALSDEGDIRDELTPAGWKNRSAPAASGTILTVDRSKLPELRPHMDVLGAQWDDIHGQWSARVGKKFAETFSTWLASLPSDLTVLLAGELAGFTDSPVAGSVSLAVQESSDMDWFDLSVELKVEDTTLTPEEIKLLLSAKGGWVRLTGKGWKRLKFNLSEEDDEQLAQLGLTARELTDEPQRMHALQLAHPAARRFMPEAQAEAVRRRASELQTRVTPPLPKGIKADLRPYQLDGFHFLSYLSTNRFGGVLADDMGLGKTLQTLAWILWLRQNARDAKQPVPPALVVCPKSVAPNWEAEAVRFVPGLRVKVWTSHGLDSVHERLDEADLHVLNYSQLRSAGESLAQVHWLAAILDEAQFIKNPTSQTAAFARALRASNRLALTGTPVENRLLDLWSIFSFTMPGILGTRAEFARLYDGKDDPFARRRLAARVRPFLLRRTKSQVARDLPDRIEEDIIVSLEGEQHKLYQAELKKARLMLLGMNTPAKLNKERFHVLSSLLRLRQICCDPRLVKANSKTGGAKNEALMETLSPLMDDGQKVLVFSQFVTQLELLQADIAKEGWKTFLLEGATENRGELVKTFEAHEGPAVFLISLKAGGFGLNLVSASYVVLYDPWWNPAVENQAIDRTHRIGQTRQVVAYRLIAKDSIEEKIRVLQKKKSALANDLLGEEKFNESLSLKDLEFLLT